METKCFLDKGSGVFEINLSDVEDPFSKEFLLTNGIGGYCSSTISGCNTRKYHGLLISSFPGLDRRVMLMKMDDEFIIGDKSINLSVNDYADGARKYEGLDYLKSIRFNPISIGFTYQAEDIRLEKRISMVAGKNVVLIDYNVENTGEQAIQFHIHPILNSRSIHDLMREHNGFSVKTYKEKAFGVNAPGSYMFLNNTHMKAEPNPVWHKDLKYYAEEFRGEGSVEDGFYPGNFTVRIHGNNTFHTIFTIASGVDEKECVNVYRQLSKIRQGGEGYSNNLGIHTLLSASSSFLVDIEGRKSIIAGYNWFNDWGRDTMISIPGLTLIPGKISSCEQILSGFLKYVKDGRIPSLFVNGVPDYHDYDGALWLIDRVNCYKRYAGPKRAKRFISKNWDNIKCIIDSYCDLTIDGLLHHESGTWMDTLVRDDAVEVQALWYNALCIYEDLSGLVDRQVDVDSSKKEFEDNFIKSYWNGKYLDDCLGDSALRPNQVIALSMDYNVIPKEMALEVLRIVEDELLTPYGLRTLDKGDSRYHGTYTGGIPEREAAYHNGSIWPWLIGPYIKAVMRYRGLEANKYCYGALQSLLSSHLLDAGLGSVSEVFDGDEPHNPRACISQAWSVAEIVRCYYEDIRADKMSV